MSQESKLPAVQDVNIEKVHTSSDTNDADNELRDDHAWAADNKNSASTELFNQVERYGGRTHVNKRSNQDDQERIFDSVKACEEDCSEVEYEVDSGELLHHLHKYAWEVRISHTPNAKRF